MTGAPEIVTRYLARAAAGDVDGVMACFTDDAWVVDEGRRHDGVAAIRAWREGAATQYTYTSTVRGTTEVSTDEWAVRVRLEGDFPGGVADLVQTFTLADDRIAGLHHG